MHAIQMCWKLKVLFNNSPILAGRSSRHNHQQVIMQVRIGHRTLTKITPLLVLPIFWVYCRMVKLLSQFGIGM